MTFEEWLQTWWNRPDKSGFPEAPLVGIARAAWNAALNQAAKEMMNHATGFTRDQDETLLISAVLALRTEKTLDTP